jgi:hypothetical protein
VTAIAIVSKKRIVYAVVVVVVAIGVLSFLLPYIGGSHGGISP